MINLGSASSKVYVRSYAFFLILVTAFYDYFAVAQWLSQTAWSNVLALSFEVETFEVCPSFLVPFIIKKSVIGDVVVKTPHN